MSLHCTHIHVILGPSFGKPRDQTVGRENSVSARCRGWMYISVLPFFFDNVSECFVELALCGWAGVAYCRCCICSGAFEMRGCDFCWCVGYIGIVGLSALVVCVGAVLVIHRPPSPAPRSWKNRFHTHQHSPSPNSQTLKPFSPPCITNAHIPTHLPTYLHTYPQTHLPTPV